MYRLEISLQPRAAHTRIAGRLGAALKVQVHAPPVGGAANAALLDLLAKTFGVSRRSVRLIRGAAGRRKVVEIDVAPAVGEARLAEILGASRVDKISGGD